MVAFDGLAQFSVATTRREARLSSIERHSHAREDRPDVLKWLLIASPLILLAAWILFRLSTIGFALLDVKSQVGVLQDEVTSLQTAELTKTGNRITADTEIAAATANDPVLRGLEHLPALGPNLRAVRQISESTEALATTVLAPGVQQLSKINTQTLRTADGGIDLDQLRPLADTVPSLVDSYDAVTAQVSKLDMTGVSAPVVAGWKTFGGLLTSAQGPLHTADKLLPLVMTSLGADGPRSYLLVFPNMAETTALGGTAAAIAELKIDNGQVTIADQGSSSDFPWRDRTNEGPILPIDPSVQNVYTQLMYYRLNLAFSRPDMPTGAQITEAFWQKYKGTTPDGVITFDPKALANMLGATGPIKISKTQSLTKQNVVAALLNKAYFTYRGNYKSAAKNSHYTDVMTTKYFELVTQKIFTTFLHKTSNPSATVQALVASVKTDDIKMWFSDAEEEKLLDGMQIQGVLPADNAEQTTTGVYFRDNSGGKMDAYLHTSAALSANTCTAADPSYEVTVTLDNDITKKKFDELPVYVKPKSGSTKTTTQVFVYAPVGSTFTTAKIKVNGKQSSATDVSVSTDLGRTVAWFTTDIAPGDKVTAEITFTGATGKLGAPSLQVTPMYNETATKVDDAKCVKR